MRLEHSGKPMPLNYSGHAIRDIEEMWLKHFSEKSAPGSHTMLLAVLNNLKPAIKFVIPNGDELYRYPVPDRHTIGPMHLPYNTCALEYRLENVRDDNEQLVPSRKRIALVLEMDGRRDAPLDGAVSLHTLHRIISKPPHTKFPSEVQQHFWEEGGWMIIPLWHDPTINAWTVCHTMVCIPRWQATEGVTVEGSKQVKMDLTNFFMPVLPEMIKRERTERGDEYIRHIMVADTFDEVLAAMAFLYMANCVNVVPMAVNEVDEAVNKKRIAKKKLPFFEYKALAIDMTDRRLRERGEQDPNKPKRRSPRLHLRRGHPRTLPDERRIWIPPMTVGSIENGIVMKDYFLFT